MTSLSLYENLFELQLSICERFHLNPFEIRKVKMHEFILLINRLSRHNEIEMSKYRKVKLPDGSVRQVKKVYASDNENI